ncbi:unnamed protein product [Effrenium voratum]|nr:unnamed protein product [Effrenium voratum]
MMLTTGRSLVLCREAGAQLDRKCAQLSVSRYWPLVIRREAVVSRPQLDPAMCDVPGRGVKLGNERGSLLAAANRQKENKKGTLVSQLVPSTIVILQNMDESLGTKNYKRNLSKKMSSPAVSLVDLDVTCSA